MQIKAYNRTDKIATLDESAFLMAGVCKTPCGC